MSRHRLFSGGPAAKVERVGCMSAALDLNEHPPRRPDPLTRAAAIAPLIAAAAEEIEALTELPTQVLDALHAAALFRTLLPRAFGGDETEPVIFAQMMEI